MSMFCVCMGVCVCVGVHQPHRMTVGVISAQKKMLRVLTACEENMPMMENATENFLFRVSLRTEESSGKEISKIAPPRQQRTQTIPEAERDVLPVSWRRLYFPITVEGEKHNLASDHSQG